LGILQKSHLTFILHQQTSRINTAKNSYLNWQKMSENCGEISAASTTVTEKTRVEFGCKWSGNFIFFAASTDDLLVFTSSVTEIAVTSN